MSWEFGDHSLPDHLPTVQVLMAPLGDCSASVTGWLTALPGSGQWFEPINFYETWGGTL